MNKHKEIFHIHAFYKKFHECFIGKSLYVDQALKARAQRCLSIKELSEKDWLFATTCLFIESDDVIKHDYLRKHIQSAEKFHNFNWTGKYLSNILEIQNINIELSSISPITTNSFLGIDRASDISFCNYLCRKTTRSSSEANGMFSNANSKDFFKLPEIITNYPDLLGDIPTVLQNLFNTIDKLYKSGKLLTSFEYDVHRDVNLVMPKELTGFLETWSSPQIHAFVLGYLNINNPKQMFKYYKEMKLDHQVACLSPTILGLMFVQQPEPKQVNIMKDWINKPNYIMNAIYKNAPDFLYSSHELWSSKLINDVTIRNLENKKFDLFFKHSNIFNNLMLEDKYNLIGNIINANLHNISFFNKSSLFQEKLNNSIYPHLNSNEHDLFLIANEILGNDNKTFISLIDLTGDVKSVLINIMKHKDNIQIEEQIDFNL